MAISNKLVSKFVKATKSDTKNTKKEKIVYGTIYDEKDGIYYVLIDGAERTIPVSRFTQKVNKDEKVIVTLKDHTAIITGSISSPSDDNQTIDNKINAAVKPSSISPEEVQNICDSVWGEE